MTKVYTASTASVRAEPRPPAGACDPASATSPACAMCGGQHAPCAVGGPRRSKATRAAVVRQCAAGVLEQQQLPFGATIRGAAVRERTRERLQLPCGVTVRGADGALCAHAGKDPGKRRLSNTNVKRAERLITDIQVVELIREVPGGFKLTFAGDADQTLDYEAQTPGAAAEIIAKINYLRTGA